MTLTRRLALVFLLILLAGAGASPAVAGEYPVFACEPSAGDVNHSWVAEGNHGGVWSYSNCPATGGDQWTRGLVAHNKLVPSNPNATVPVGSYAAMVLRAPGGAGLSRITYDHYLCGWGGFRAGIMNGEGQWLRYAGPDWCGVMYGTRETLDLGGTSGLKIMTQCVERPCAVGSAQPHGWAAFRSATVTVVDHTAPNVSLNGGSALASGWLRGAVSVGVAASDNVGVLYADVQLDGRTQSSVLHSCDHRHVVPCPQLDRGFDADTRTVPDGRRVLAGRVKDTAGNWHTAATEVHVDNTPPSAPRDLKVVGGDGWRQRNEFALEWTNPPQGGAAPIARADVGICPAGNNADSWTGCRYAEANKRDAASISELKVPQAGDWVARVWLRDAAGNHDPRAAQAVPLRFDDTPPTVSFAGFDAADPTRVDLVAEDAISPLARTELEIQRQGEAAWTSVPTTSTPTGFSGRMDDEHLADGVYHLRARVHDSAGNESSTDRDPGGALVTRTVPLRIDTRLVAGRVKRKRARRSRGGRRRMRRVIVVRPRVRYGRKIPIRGRLTTPGANPVANASIEVWQQIARPNAKWRRVAMIGTNPKGRFKFKARRGPSRLLRFRYPGTPLVRAQTTEVKIQVSAGTSIRASRERVVNGDEVVFRGRIKGRPLPRTGKLVQMQVHSRGSWLTFATPRAKAKSGRWRYRYRFTATRGTVRYRFRARLPRESAYPYDTGVSRAVGIVVRGL